MRGWLGWLAGGTALALLVTLAVVSQGFDAREAPRADPAVWVERATGQYARVNTETAEIDTVRVADSPSDLVQASGSGVLLTQGFGRAWPIDPTNPQDVREDRGGADAVETPAGTREVLAAGAALVYLTEAGDVYLANVGRPGETLRVEGRADAVALDETGRVALYTEAAATVRWFDAETGAPGAVEEVPGAVPGGEKQLAIIGDSWALLDSARGQLWRAGAEAPVALDLRGRALLQGSSSGRGIDGDATIAAELRNGAILVADEAGLWSADRNGVVTRVAETLGTPARPQLSGGTIVAAWVSAAAASLWTSADGLQPVELDPAVTGLDDPQPVVRTNGERAVVAEIGSGMLWRVPDGRLIPVEQWTSEEPPEQDTGDAPPQDVADQLPPVAVDDRFGVRAAEPVLLPVLLNDYDPNRRDVLTIVPEGLGDGLSPDFGRVSVLPDGQGLVLQPGPDARGTARFSYRVTDGTQVSPAASVRLSVVSEGENSAPEWCPVTGCRRDWPSPEMTPGGTLVVPILDGWVDPEGDPFALTGVRVMSPDTAVRALVVEDGRLAIRHTDPDAAASTAVLRVTVTDARGASGERDLTVRVRPDATAVLPPIASTVQVGETAVLRPLARVIGGSGSLTLADAVVQTGSARDVSVRVRPGAGSIEVDAQRSGGFLIAVTVRDMVTEQDIAGVIRVDAVERRPSLAVPPLRAFVRPLADSTIDVLAAVPSAAARGLSVRSATVVDGQLRADVIEHSRIRVAGGTADGDPGRIGAVDVVVVEGRDAATGRITVFQAPEGSGGVIAVADTATVRAGAVVDIPVLENDVSPPGDRLVLSPELSAPGAPGELAFVSGGSVRYLAPDQPGEYQLTYTASAIGNPKARDSATIRVTVVPQAGNRQPQPAALTVRIAPGERVTANVPLSGVDPDGDRVRLVSVEQPADAQLSVSVQPRTSAIRVEASRSAVPGRASAGYLVRDGRGGEARGVINVIVTEPDPGGGAPVVYSDYVRMVRGAEQTAVIRPLDNDLDPRGGRLSLLEVVPNEPGGPESAEYQRLAKRLDLSRLAEGVVGIAGSNDAGSASFRYTVRSSESTSTADGLIVAQTSDRVSAQAPNVMDTVVSVRDRASLANEGVDVVTGRVQWSTGDVGALTLSIWGDAAERFTVRGDRIVGAYRAEGDLVPFRLSGPDSSGKTVKSFGFLIIPPLDELRLSLRPNLEPITVNEGEQRSIAIADVLDLGPGDQVEMAAGPFATQRSQAGCAPRGSTTLRYSAGAGGPWDDRCTVLVKLAEQTRYTAVPVPIEIVPDAPVVTLNPLTRTIRPGGTASVALVDMIEWAGGREGSLDALRWSLGSAGQQFQVSLEGDTVALRARADAVPGSQETVQVSVSGAGESRATLTLRVSEAARDAPRGATVSLNCTVGETCATPLVGVAGEHDPFAGRPGGGLTLVSVDGSGCRVGLLSASGNSVRVAWPSPDGPGGTCVARFTVKDAQLRTGTGTIEFEALGKPPAPASAQTIGFTDTSVTIRVDPGEAQGAYPGLTRMLLRQLDSGASTTCVPDAGFYRCAVGGLVIGQPHDFVAIAVNSVGESAPSPALTSWAYRAPAAPEVTAVQVAGETTEDSGSVRVTITGQSDVRGYRLLLDGGLATTLEGRTVDSVVSLPVGAHSLTAVPISRIGSPMDPADNLGSSSPPQALTVAGLPRLGQPDHQYDPVTNRLIVVVNADANLGGALRYGADLGDSCQINSNDPTISIPLTAANGDTVRVTVCARNDWGTSARTTDLTISTADPEGTP